MCKKTLLLGVQFMCMKLSFNFRSHDVKSVWIVFDFLNFPTLKLNVYALSVSIVTYLHTIFVHAIQLLS
jgi:hypothetical protein